MGEDEEPQGNSLSQNTVWGVNSGQGSCGIQLPELINSGVPAVFVFGELVRTKLSEECMGSGPNGTCDHCPAGGPQQTTHPQVFSDQI